MNVHNWNLIAFRVLTHSTNHCTCHSMFRLVVLFVALELCCYTTSISRYFLILACILYIFLCFRYKHDNKNGANSWFFLFLPQFINIAKMLCFCRTKQNRQKEKSYLVYILRWKATQSRLWPEALQNFIQTKYSIYVNIGILVFHPSTLIHARTHTFIQKGSLLT